MNKLFWELKNIFLINFYFIFVFIFLANSLLLNNIYKAIIDLIFLVFFYFLRVKMYITYNKKFDLNFFLVYFIFISLFNNVYYTFVLANLSLLLVLAIKIYLTFEKATKVDYFKNNSKKSKIFTDKAHLIQNEKNLDKITSVILEIIIYNLSFFIVFYFMAYFYSVNNFYLFLLIFIVLFYSLKNFIFYLYDIIVKKISLNDYIFSLLIQQKKIIPNLKIDSFLFIISLGWFYFMVVILYYTYLLTLELFLIVILITLIFYKVLKTLENVNEEVLELLNLFVDVLERRDRYTFDHSNRVAYFSYYLAKEINLSIDEIDLIYKAASIHDIGKILINDSILEKKGKLAPEEFEIVKLHVKELKNILLPIYPFFKEIIDVAQLHHEKLDGSGYPFNYKDNQIPLYSRIITIADIFDALVLDRPYRPGFNYNKAINILVNEAEQNKIDKFLVNTFTNISLNPEILENINKIKSMIRTYQVNLIKLISKGFSDFIDDIT